MENTYIVRITTATVEDFVAGEIKENTCRMVDVNLTQSVESSSLTKKMIAETVQKMLYNNTILDPEDLEEGNDHFSLFSRIEDNGGSHTPDANDGFFVTYSVEVFQKVSICDLPLG